jgi:hypothetical protein
MRCFISLAFILLTARAFSTTGQPDTVKMLLQDIAVQFEATDAMHQLYNFKFEKAEKTFRWFRYKYRNHPLPYFLLGLAEWWKIVPNYQVTKYDDGFLAYMDSSIYYAEKMFEANSQNKEAAFFLAAAHGFKGRLHSERKNWRKATFSGKYALEYLELSKGESYLGPEFLFGDALYNYFSVWIPENYPWLKPILMFFPKGDKKLGLQQLKTVAENAFYTRTEAQTFLMTIYAVSENDNQAALPVAKYLHETFPDNPYFQRYYARQLYYTGNFLQSEKVSLNILAKIDSMKPGYEAVSGRYASFFLGQINEAYRRYPEAKKYYQKALEYGKSLEQQESGFYLYSLTNLAQIAIAENKPDEAKKYYKEVIEYASKDHPTYEEAKDYIKGKKKKKKK